MSESVRFFFGSAAWLAIAVQGLMAGPVLKTATTHPMQYYVSLPKDWSADKRWPVVVSLDGAGKVWLSNAQNFEKARDKGNYPFIVVTPLILTNGGRDLRALPAYSYAPAVWDDVDRTGRCAFDAAGVRAVVSDIRQIYNGEQRYYLTGFSAGGHLAWATIFQHPEELEAASLVEGNYTGRCVTSEVDPAPPFSTDPRRSELPIRIFKGQFGVAVTEKQANDATSIAVGHGYRKITRTMVYGAGHVSMADNVLQFFNSLLRE